MEGRGAGMTDGGDAVVGVFARTDLGAALVATHRAGFARRWCATSSRGPERAPSTS
jgi:hypothetical protein